MKNATGNITLITDTSVHYIDGHWEKGKETEIFSLVHPADGLPYGAIKFANYEQAEQAINAAHNAFPLWANTDKKTRSTYVEKILKAYQEKSSKMAYAIMQEMGAPIDFAYNAQTKAGKNNIENFLNCFKDFQLEKYLDTNEKNTNLFYEPIGPVGLITPWNWPIHQITLKVIAALLAGCTMVLKPSELAPLSAIVFMEILESSGLPKGVCNLIHGRGETIGSYLARHNKLSMISFTGSTAAGKSITKESAINLKRVTLELGGKGANIICKDADHQAVKRGVWHCMRNSGQSCNAPTRMLVEREIYHDALQIAQKEAEKIVLGASKEKGTHIGPLVSKKQYEHARALIQSGIEENAKLLCGGLKKPHGLENGFYILPTIFYDVLPNMRIFQEEIFAPVLTITPFDSIEEAINLANDTIYGLTNYVQSQDLEKCKRIAKALKSGMVEANGQYLPEDCFFGGIKASGQAREGGLWGIKEFCTTKAYVS